MKNMHAISFFIMSIFSLAFAANNKIKDKYLESYMSEVVDQLFYPHHHHNERSSLINHLVKTIREHETTSSQAWSWSSWAYEKSYSLDYIEQVIRGHLLDWIKEKAYLQAQKMGQSKATSQKIADKIYDCLFNKFAQSSYLEQGILAQYVGHQLQDEIRKEIKPLANQHAQIYYPQESCCVCQEFFDQNTKQVFLHPCGHDVCAGCAYAWFFDHGKKSCPMCRAQIDLHKLEQALTNIALNSPSAPLLDE